MIDLHLHTVHSDGTDTVKQLLEKAEEKKLEIISITDHDSVDAYFEMENSKDLRNIFKGKIIVGSELHTTYNKVNIEVLAYGIDYKNLRIQKVEQDKIQKNNLNFFKEIGKKLNLKFDENIITIPGDVSKQFASNVFGEEILKYEENQKILLEIGEMFDRNTFYRIHESNPKSPFYIDTSAYYRSIDEVIEDIHNAGGLAFLAHGFEYSFPDKYKTIENILKTTKIDGAECEYPKFSKEQRNYIKELCKKYNKFLSGGTDYHAKNKPNIDLGTGINKNININIDLINDWYQKVKYFE